MPAPPVRLLVGPEELLLHRAAERLLEEVAAGSQLELTDVRAAELRDSGLPDLRTGSLFGAPRALLVRGAQELPAEVAAGLLAELERGGLACTVVLLASGTGRIQRLAKKVAEFGGRTDVAPPREWEERRWEQLVAAEFRRHGRRADPAAVTAVLGHAGLDVATIAEKVAQVAAAAPAGTVRAEAVDAVVVGHGSRGSFAVADAVCDRNPVQALELLRGAFEAGDDPVLVLGALAYRLRSLVAVAGGLAGKAAGVNLSAGQVRRLQAVRRSFGPGELTAAYAQLAHADREIKGGELPAQLVVERAVVAVATRS